MLQGGKGEVTLPMVTGLINFVGLPPGVEPSPCHNLASA